MFRIGELISSLSKTLTSRRVDSEIEDLQDSVKALNYELSLLRYRDSDDEDIRLAYEYLKKRPFCAAMYPYEKTRSMAPIEVQSDEDSKLCYVMHNGHPLYFPKGEKEKIIPWLYRFAIEDEDISGNGYRQRNPHAYQSERYHIEEGDILIDAGGGRGFAIMDMVNDVIDKIGKSIIKHSDDDEQIVELDIGSARGLFALDVIDKVSKVYLLESHIPWQNPLEATFAPYMNKVELMKASLSVKKIIKKEDEKENKKEDDEDSKKKRVGLVEMLEKCEGQRVFVVMDIEGEELDVLKDAQEYLKAAKNPITLAVCAYHRTTDYKNLMRFFESIGYHTETQPGYIYTNLNDGHGLHSLRRGIIRASNQ
jgi:FkbM family methyltransferase